MKNHIFILNYCKRPPKRLYFFISKNKMNKIDILRNVLFFYIKVYLPTLILHLTF